jgi:MoCo/4Fe-4S cofactor protein with predicted Tat translocation signal
MTEQGSGSSYLDLASIRAKLESEGGKRFWQSLEELAETENYQDLLRHEFTHDIRKEPYLVSRRSLLKLMAASAAFAGLTACTKLPTEKITPYASQRPEDFVPGKPIYFATAMPHASGALGLLVESHMGRPTKVEGNPDHPASLGATDVFAQASVLTLYDPDRAEVVIHNGRIGDWSTFLDQMEALRLSLALNQGAGFRILTETVTSPTLADQVRTLLGQFPRAKWHQYEPCGRDNVRVGSQMAFGEFVNTYYRFDRADVVLALDADFFCSPPAGVRYARDFVDRRRVTGPDNSMNRLYAVESTATITGAMADHRLPLRSSEVEAFARAAAEGLGVKVDSSGSALPSTWPADWVPAFVRDLQRHPGSSIVLTGDQQPPIVHAIAHAMNQALGNVGNTVIYTDPVEASPVDQLQSLRELVEDIQAGAVDTLVIVGGNPAYNAPSDLHFARNLLKVSRRIHISLYEDETAELCHWHIPEAHFLESWSDARAHDGTASVIQPLISPLYDGRSPHELLAVLSGHPGRTAHEIVRDYWKGQNLAKDFEAAWQVWLERGTIPNTALAQKRVHLISGFAVHVSPASAAGETNPPARTADGELEIVFRPDPTVWDGRHANNGFLQELQKPLTKLTWDNAALIGATTAQRLGLSNEDVVLLHYHGRSVRAPVWIMPGHADNSVTANLGYGRRRAGRVGTGIGFDAYALRTSSEPWFGRGLRIEKTGEHFPLAVMQHHYMEQQKGREAEEESIAAHHRELVRVATLEEFRKNPDFAKDPPQQTTKAQSLYSPYDYSKGYQWGMAIDNNSCVGCNACVTACRVENNIPVVGKEEVRRGRHMNWIRVDTYYRGNLDKPETYNEVVLCMQCENAPCEYVCPVGATVHSPEGLNEMIYNRCVGTRYCSNNCPYKVRRFNFELYSDWTTPSLYALRNPDVTVRSRGVMEKCTYCIQRIQEIKIKAEEAGREIRDGEILTACQQACPTQAIVFGNINDPNSRVAKLKAQSRNYGLLTELNTRPRTTYLAKLRNPNPEIKE